MASRKWFEFDPTIHAGHVMTALTIIVCSIGAWYDVKTSVAQLKEENARQESRMTSIEEKSEQRIRDAHSSVEKATAEQHTEMVKMRDDMNAWFMRLNDKLDTKMDKHSK